MEIGNEIEKYIGTKEISEYLDVTKDTLHKWIKSGSIPCHRIGRLWKFKISEIDQWVKSGNAATE
jgi:excisionase family DNA binding protein